MRIFLVENESYEWQKRNTRERVARRLMIVINDRNGN